MGIDNAMAHKHALKDRKNDLYETPGEATRALIANAALPPRIWEPACGRGAIARELEAAGHEVFCSDLVDYGLAGAKPGRDFLMEPAAPEGFNAIVTNPPFKLANEFAARAIAMVDDCWMLLRLNFLEGGHSNPHRLFALDGGALSEVIVFADRLPMMHRDGWDGPKANSGTAFAWFHWRRGPRGATRIRRIWADPMKRAQAYAREGAPTEFPHTETPGLYGEFGGDPQGDE